MAASRIYMLSKCIGAIRSTTHGGFWRSYATHVNEMHKKIQDLVNSNGVVVFMKGVPTAPNCGYSDAVCQILKAYEVEFKSYDVLADDDLRREVKTFSDWPTIPQVYINGSFVGGCDTLLQMHQSGELEQMFKKINK